MPARRVTLAELRSPSFPERGEFTAVVVVRKLSERLTKGGNPFLVAELGDRTGSVACNVFEPASPVGEALRAAGEGGIAEVAGLAETFQGRPSPKLSTARALSEDEAAAQGLIGCLVETAPEDAAPLAEELRGYAATLRPAELRATVEGVLDELGATFLDAPAAVSMHHAYRHGLLEHTVHLCRAARALLPLYPEVPGDLALAGLILHDAGKALEFTGNLAPKKTRTGLLNGHVVLGYRLARKWGVKARLPADLLERLEHIVLSHQGEPEWGAAVYASTPEAVFVALVDNLDAKMGMVQRALRLARENGPGAEFSERLAGLNTSLLLPPPEGGR